MSILLSLALSARAADYNCDGYDDLAVGVIGESPDGGVHILHGGAGGITTIDTWRPASYPQIGASWSFGWYVAAVDLDDDGCDELAVSTDLDGLYIRRYIVPNPWGGESWEHLEGEMFGSPGELAHASAVATVNTSLFAGDPSLVVGGYSESFDGLFRFDVDANDDLVVPGTAYTGSSYGTLAVGDFDNDGYDDVVAGDLEYFGSLDDGIIEVYLGGFGSPVAVTQTLARDDLGVYAYDTDFNGPLAVGDFDDDGYDDLAIGSQVDSGFGAVTVVEGDSSGLDGAHARIFQAGVGGVAGLAGDWGGEFGASLAVGDFDHDGYDDLAIGERSSDYYSYHAGAVHVLYGSSTGLSTWTDQIWGQDSPNVEGRSGGYERFGHALAAGDYNGDGYDDLAISSVYETTDAGNVEDAGAVNLLYGSASRLTATGDRIITQDSSGIDDSCEPNDYFGWSLR